MDFLILFIIGWLLIGVPVLLFILPPPSDKR